MKLSVFSRHLSIAVLAGVVPAAAADVRVIHASPDAPNVDVYVNQTIGVDAPAISNLAFTQGTGYLPLPTGLYDLQVTAFGGVSPVIDAQDVHIDQNIDVSVVAINFLNSITPLILVDDRTSDASNARIRFVHAAPDVPTVDIALAGGGGTLFDAVSFGNSGGYISVPGGSYDLEVQLDSDNSLALAVPGLQVENGFVYTVFAMGSQTQGNVQAVVFVDAIPAPGAVATSGAGLLMASRRRR